MYLRRTVSGLAKKLEKKLEMFDLFLKKDLHSEFVPQNLGKNTRQKMDTALTSSVKLKLNVRSKKKTV